MKSPRWYVEPRSAGFAASLAAVVVILVLHYHTGLHRLGMHDFLRRLFYLPVVTAAIVAGLRGGLLTAGLAALAYLPHMRQLAGAGDRTIDSALELLLLPAIAALVGGFADRSRRARALAAERGRMAALGEIGLGVMAQVEGPLSAIEGQAESLSLLAELRPDGAVGFAARRIQDEAARARRLAGDLRMLAVAAERRVMVVDLAALVTGVAGDVAAARDQGGRIRVAQASGRLAIRADGHALAYALRSLLYGVLEVIPASDRVAVGFASYRGRAVIEIAVSSDRGEMLDLRRSLSAVFGAQSSDYHLRQALCFHMLAAEGAVVEIGQDTARQSVIRMRFRLEPAPNRRTPQSLGRRARRRRTRFVGRQAGTACAAIPRPGARSS